MSTTTEVKRKVVFIMNGPPNSGKDYAAKVITNKIEGAVHLEFKKALRELAHHIATVALGPNANALRDVKAVSNGIEYGIDKTLKDTVTVDFYGNRTWRQFLIWISETVMKPIFGEDIFGRAAAKLVQETDASVIVFSDGGFQVEVDVLGKIEGVTVVVVQLERAGCEWGNDSRGYVEADGQHPWVIINAPDTFDASVIMVVETELRTAGVPYAFKT